MRRFLFACVFPAMGLYTVFMLLPTLNVFRMSLYRWGGYSQEREFVGLQNFQKLFQDQRFFLACQNTLLLIVVVSLVTLALALMLGAVLSRARLWGKGLFRVVFYIPNILSAVVIGAIFAALYDPNDGLLNSLLGYLGMAPVMWLGSRQVVIYAIAGAMIWQAVGYYMVMYMAAMAAVPESLYEAASIDGAGALRQFTQMTLPMIWQTVRTTLTFFVISNINLSFLLVKTMTEGGPDGASEVALSYMYRQAYTNSSYGYGMAIGVAVFLFSFALSAVLNGVTRREETGGGG